MIYQYRCLPCPNFGIGDFQIINRHGFFTFPHFIDNGFKAKGGMKWKKALGNLKQYRPLFFIAHDNDPLKDLSLLSQYSPNIILPLHKKTDLKLYEDYFSWIGFPNNAKLRDFDIQWFLDNTQEKKRWWLGLHDYPTDRPDLIWQFHGLDSTLPEVLAGQYGKIWVTWREYFKPATYLHWRTMFEINVHNFRVFLDHVSSPSPNLLHFL